VNYPYLCEIESFYYVLKGQSYRQIGKTLNLRFSTVRYVIKRHEESGITENKHRSGRPQILTTRQQRQIIKWVVKEPVTSAQTLCAHIATTSGKHVSAQTIRNYCTTLNYVAERRGKSLSQAKETDKSGWSLLKHM
jgi:transposase